MNRIWINGQDTELPMHFTFNKSQNKTKNQNTKTLRLLGCKDVAFHHPMKLHDYPHL